MRATRAERGDFSAVQKTEIATTGVTRNRELVTRMTADLLSYQPIATERTESRAADRLAVGLILVFEACAAVAVLLMLRLVVRFLLAPEHAFTQISAQAARFLAYWALLLFVHAVALAWFRRATSMSSALDGFAGIVYLGCGYVFSLVLASAADTHGWPEELKAFLGIVLAPNLTWLSSLAGCLLLLRALTTPRMPPVDAYPANDRLKPELRTCAASSPGPLTCAAFLPAVSTTLVLVAAISAGILWRAGAIVTHWVLKQSADRSLDFLGAACYGAVYLLASLLVLAAAVVCGRRAIRRDDPELLWLAALLAGVGGLQHIVLLGLPALAVAVLAIRAANRRAPPPAGTLVMAIRQSWGLPKAIAFFLLAGLLFLKLSTGLPSLWLFR